MIGYRLIVDVGTYINRESERWKYIKVVNVKVINQLTRKVQSQGNKYIDIYDTNRLPLRLSLH